MNINVANTSWCMEFVVSCHWLWCFVQRIWCMLRAPVSDLEVRKVCISERCETLLRLLKTQAIRWGACLSRSTGLRPKNIAISLSSSEDVRLGFLVIWGWPEPLRCLAVQAWLEKTRTTSRWGVIRMTRNIYFFFCKLIVSRNSIAFHHPGRKWHLRLDGVAWNGFVGWSILAGLSFTQARDNISGFRSHKHVTTFPKAKKYISTVYCFHHRW